MGVAIKTFVMNSGERYCLLVDASSSIPLYYPNLFITTQIRNRSLSYSAMEASLGGISVLMRFLDERKESIEVRFLQGRFFDEFEMDAIRDFCQINFRVKATIKYGGTPLKFCETQERNDFVSLETIYIRLTTIAQYVKWLAEQLVGSAGDRLKTVQIAKMEKGLKARRPAKKNRNLETDEKGLTEDQLNLLFEIFRPESNLNPFKNCFVRERNRLIFLMLYHLGLRGGELLNVRIRDIDFGKNQLLIARRADEKDDPRKFQPLVKTLDRRLPLKDTLAKEIHTYIASNRRLIQGASKNDFLFVTHKAGVTQGQPLSKSGYKKILDVVRNVSPTLFNLTGHQLRHLWNEKFSELMDSMNEAPSEEQQEKMRTYLMGWREGSGSAATYNKRFIKRKANEAALKLQAGMVRMPRGVING